MQMTKPVEDGAVAMWVPPREHALWDLSKASEPESGRGNRDAGG